jgi:hypothetical protein
MPSSYEQWMVLDDQEEDDLEYKVMCVVAYILKDLKDPELELSDDAYNCIY